ncbi:alpha/beta hydrolase [Methylocystis echinoides]|uniref:alpha/beta fold hydrolase n=1 Tax=Methylocystis echinoides TaxID=29468 RepID=UPI00342D326C
MSSTRPAESRFIAAADGLRLHYLDYPAPDAMRLPLVCLPGLARTADDFWRVAETTADRRVLALDYRGRGRSAWDTDWRHYDLDVEQADIFAVLADAGVTEAAFLGTSRGGLHTMRIAKARPALVRAAILNDIGPKVEKEGLLRIKRYVGKLPPLSRLSEAVALMRMTAAPQFAGVSAEEWETYARQTFVETESGVELRYDPALNHTLDVVTPDAQFEEFWEPFAVLARVPILALRGETSDILSVEVFDEMARRAPLLERHTVPGQGHAPLLLDQPTLDRIKVFLNACP